MQRQPYNQYSSGKLILQRAWQISAVMVRTALPVIGILAAAGALFAAEQPLRVRLAADARSGVNVLPSLGECTLRRWLARIGEINLRNVD